MFSLYNRVGSICVFVIRPRINEWGIIDFVYVHVLI